MSLEDPFGASLRERLRADAGAYCAFFCEENVARALAALPPGTARRLNFALVVSNEEGTVAMDLQRASESRGGSVVWDYHVVLLSIEEGGWFVHDLDSMLAPFPAPAAAYLQRSFPRKVAPRHQPCFRLVGAELFLARFASTRQHMRDGATGAWLKPPPSWPCLRGGSAGEDDNLARWKPSGAASGDDVDAGFGADAPGVDALLALMARVREARRAEAVA